jgi:hypothetical protein
VCVRSLELHDSSPRCKRPATHHHQPSPA